MQVKNILFIFEKIADSLGNWPYRISPIKSPTRYPDPRPPSSARGNWGGGGGGLPRAIRPLVHLLPLTIASQLKGRAPALCQLSCSYSSRERERERGHSAYSAVAASAWSPSASPSLPGVFFRHYQVYASLPQARSRSEAARRGRGRERIKNHQPAWNSGAAALREGRRGYRHRRPPCLLLLASPASCSSSVSSLVRFGPAGRSAHSLSGAMMFFCRDLPKRLNTGMGTSAPTPRSGHRGARLRATPLSCTSP